MISQSMQLSICQNRRVARFDTPLRELGRGANSRLVTTCPLFNPTNKPVFTCGVAIFTGKVSNRYKKS